MMDKVVGVVNRQTTEAQSSSSEEIKLKEANERLLYKLTCNVCVRCKIMSEPERVWTTHSEGDHVFQETTFSVHRILYSLFEERYFKV